jgi:uncharacterized membrane protein
VKYRLSEKDEQKIRFLTGLGSLVLKQIEIPYTLPYLKEAVTRAYFEVFESASFSSDNAGEFTVADLNDPSNLAIVLLEAFKKYHLKYEVVDSSEPGDGAGMLLILSAGENKEYSDSLGLLDKKEKDEVYLINPGKRVKLNKNDTVENYILLKRSSFTGEPSYQLNRNRLVSKKVFLYASLLLALLITGFAAYGGIENYNPLLWIPELFILLAGGVTGYNLYVAGTGDVSAGYLAKKFCINKQKGNQCQQVLSSPASSILGIISMTDAGIIYFTSLFSFTISGLLTGSYTNFLPILFWCSIIPLPYTVFSIYYQLKVLKRTCMLCMMTQIILWIQFAYFLFISKHTNTFFVPLPQLLLLLVIIAFISALYLLFQKHNKLNRQFAELSLQNEKYKKDTGIFDILSKRGINFSVPDLPGALVLGDSRAQMQLTAILSPACIPCGNMIRGLERLTNWYDDKINIQIYLTCDIRYQPLADALLALTLAGKHTEAVLLLNDWYEFLTKEKIRGNNNGENIIQKWKHQWPANEEKHDTVDITAVHIAWFSENIIPYTPLLVYGGHFLPTSFYDMEILGTIIEKKMEEENGN